MVISDSSDVEVLPCDNKLSGDSHSCDLLPNTNSLLSSTSVTISSEISDILSNQNGYKKDKKGKKEPKSAVPYFTKNPDSEMRMNEGKVSKYGKVTSSFSFSIDDYDNLLGLTESSDLDPVEKVSCLKV